MCLEEPQTSELEAIAEEEDENLSNHSGGIEGAHYQVKNYQKDLRGQTKEIKRYISNVNSKIAWKDELIEFIED